MALSRGASLGKVFLEDKFHLAAGIEPLRWTNLVEQLICEVDVIFADSQPPQPLQMIEHKRSW